MKRNFAYRVISLILAFVPYFAKSDVLLWTVGADTTVVGSGNPSETVYSYIEPVTWDGNKDKIFARVAVKDSSGNILRYLENFKDGDWVDAFDAGIDIGHPNSPNGVGTGTNLSDAHNRLMSEYYFQVQIAKGHQSLWDDTAPYILSEILLYSDNISGGTLKENANYYIDEDNYPEGYTPWDPPVYYTYDPGFGGSVPEPSSGILVIVGACVLTLRRRKNA